jgi:hypothetical protein
MCALEEVQGFNQMNKKYNGIKMVQEGLARLKKRYSAGITNLIALMLTFEEDKRPCFCQIADQCLQQADSGKNYRF